MLTKKYQLYLDKDKSTFIIFFLYIEQLFEYKSTTTKEEYSKKNPNFEKLIVC